MQGWQWQTKYGNKCGYYITAPCTVLHNYLYINSFSRYFWLKLVATYVGLVM